MNRWKISTEWEISIEYLSFYILIRYHQMIYTRNHIFSVPCRPNLLKKYYFFKYFGCKLSYESQFSYILVMQFSRIGIYHFFIVHFRFRNYHIGCYQ